MVISILEYFRSLLPQPVPREKLTAILFEALWLALNFNERKMVACIVAEMIEALRLDNLHRSMLRADGAAVKFDGWLKEALKMG